MMYRVGRRSGIKTAQGVPQCCAFVCDRYSATSSALQCSPANFVTAQSLFCLEERDVGESSLASDLPFAFRWLHPDVPQRIRHAAHHARVINNKRPPLRVAVCLDRYTSLLNVVQTPTMSRYRVGSTRALSFRLRSAGRKPTRRKSVTPSRMIGNGTSRSDTRS